MHHAPCEARPPCAPAFPCFITDIYLSPSKRSSHFPGFSHTKVPSTPDNVPLARGVSYVYISAIYNGSNPFNSLDSEKDKASPPAAAALQEDNDWTVIEANICACNLFVSSQYLTASPLLWYVRFGTHVGRMHG